VLAIVGEQEDSVTCVLCRADCDLETRVDGYTCAEAIKCVQWLSDSTKAVQHSALSMLSRQREQMKGLTELQR